MAELKTKVNNASVGDFLNSIDDDGVRSDCWTIVKMLQDATKAKPEMWGASIVGFGRFQYRYPDGRSMEWMKVGFSPRKQNIVLYIMSGFEDYDALLSKLGKHSHGKSCLYIKRLSDIHIPTLKKLVKSSISHVNKLDRQSRS